MGFNAKNMKSNHKTLILPLILIIFNLFVLASAGLAQQPPPPPDTHGTQTNNSPLSAPIASGIVVFLAFGIGYTGWEIYKIRKKSKKI